MGRIEDVNGLLQLIESVYAAAVDEALWATMAPEIAKTFNSTSTTLQLPAHGEGKPELLSVTSNLKNAMGEYRDYFCHRDIWIDRAIELRTSGIAASKDLLSDSEFERSEFYRDWCRHIEAFYVLGAVFTTGPGQLGVLGIHRPKSAGTYQEAEKAFASRFLPHLQRALQIRRRFAEVAFDQSVSFDKLERTDTTIFVITEDQHILFANALAQALLRNGSAFMSKRGRLTANHYSTNEHLSMLIRGASRVTVKGSLPGGALAIPCRHGMPLTAQVYPFQFTRPGSPPSSAIVFVRDPYQPISVLVALRAMFHLTQAEARIAQGLVNGQSLNDIAIAQGTQPQTLRKQLKAIFSKTGTNRQAQLVALILRSVALVTERVK